MSNKLESSVDSLAAFAVWCSLTFILLVILYLILSSLRNVIEDKIQIIVLEDSLKTVIISCDNGRGFSFEGVNYYCSKQEKSNEE